MQRRTLVKTAAALAAAPTLARAQSAWPNRPVKLVVPFGAGGATDIIARLISQKLSELWGQSVLVDYKPEAPGITEGHRRRGRLGAQEARHAGLNSPTSTVINTNVVVSAFV